MSCKLGALAVFVSLAVVVAACAPPAPSPPAGEPSPGVSSAAAVSLASPSAAPRVRVAPGVDYIRYPDEPMKPAFRTVLTKPAKGDQYDDIRALSPEQHAITVPPPASVRPMVEWEPMKSIVMGVPTYMSSYSNAWQTIIQIAKHSLTVAEVWFLVESQLGKDLLINGLLTAGVTEDEIISGVRFSEQPIDSIWFIDYGPLPLVDDATGTFAFTDFRYYHNRPLDDGVPSLLGRRLPALGMDAPIPTYRMPLNTEGGTFQATTDGICITGNRQLYYMSCAQGGCDSAIRTLPLDQVQDHPLAKQVRDIWREYAGCVDTIITNSITDDGTGHIDMYLKIADDQTVIVGEYVQPFAAGSAAELNKARMDANAALLEAYDKPDGTSFNVARIVMPGHRAAQGGGGTDWMPFTYINSTLINGLNLWPAFTYDEWVESRTLAQSQWEEVMPDHEHIWIDSAELSFWSGAIHCITRTVPDKAPGQWVPDGDCVHCSCDAPYGGYDGECTIHGGAPETGDDDLCYGPEWLCSCNDCTGSCPGDDDGVVVGQGDPCMGLTYDGCCESDEVLRYCDGGELRGGTCQEGSQCGWIAEEGWYDCGGAGEDPTGAKPRDCATVFAEYDGSCEPDCTGRECGGDGCGGTCGSCNECSECNSAGLCVVDCTDECDNGSSGCDGDVAWACAPGIHGCTRVFETDCGVDGDMCISGACVAPADATGPGTIGPGSDVGDASGGGADDATSGAGEEDGAGPAGADTGAEGDAGNGGDSGGGCAGGGSNTPRGPLVLLAIILVVCRQRFSLDASRP